MANTCCSLDVLAPRREGGFLRLEADLRIGRREPRRLWFEVETPDEHVPERDARPFVLASLVAAMRAGLPLVADAPLDGETRRNLRLWQGAFAAWRPALMSMVELRAPGASGDVRRAKGRVTAYSGGADSHYSLIASAEEGFPIEAGVLVHGFDIPLADGDAYERAFRRVRSTLEGRGLRALRLRTNVRSVDRWCHLSWQHETHGAYLAAGLACLSPWYGSAVIPSSFGHDYPVLPWASNALTDPLFSGSVQDVIHHGGERMRIEKMLRLATDVDFARSARVCYLNEQKDANCGRCYKCATLQLAFWTSGIPRPDAFPVRVTRRDLAAMKLLHPSYRHTFEVLATRAEQAGLAEEAGALRTALRRDPPVTGGSLSRLLPWIRRSVMR
jgi:hypothetical protein